MYKTICITNRHLVNGDFLEQIHKIAQSSVNTIILREKDLSLREYENLAKQVIEICDKYNTECILHTFTEVALKLNHYKIHLPLKDFLSLDKKTIGKFKVIGVSTHSINDALLAQQAGATYITASHIFKTQCKEGITPRGLDYLKDVCKIAKIPVYALGGIDLNNAKTCIENGANGVCMMSYYMKSKEL